MGRRYIKGAALATLWRDRGWRFPASSRSTMLTLASSGSGFMIVLRYLLLGLGLCVLATLGWRLTHGASGRDVVAGAPKITREASVSTASDTSQVSEARRVVVNRMKDVPQFATFYDALATAYPRLYDGIVDANARRLAEAGVLGSAETLFWDALRTLQQAQGIMAARAGPEVLTSFFDARLALLDALAPVDPKLCADFLYGTTDASIDTFSAQHRDLVASLAVKELAAVEAGHARSGDAAKPTSADIDLVASGMASRRLTPDEIAVLIDGKSADPPIPDARLCEMGRVYLSVLGALPPDVRQRVYGFAAELLVRS